MPTTLITGAQAAAIIGAIRFAFRVENVPVPDELEDVIEMMRVAWAAMRAMRAISSLDSEYLPHAARTDIAQRAFGSGPCAVCVFGRGVPGLMVCTKCGLAFMQGTHVRLGVGSLLRRLPTAVLMRILQLGDSI